MSKFRLTYAGGKYAGKKIVDLLKSIKRVAGNKKSKANIEKAGKGTKSLKAYNIRAGARDSKVVPIKDQSQKGSSFQPHKVRGKQAPASSKLGSSGTAESWRSDMERLTNMPSFNELRRSIKKKRKALGGVASFKRGGDNMPARNKKNFRSTKSGAGMTAAGVAAYRRKNPGSKLSTAVTENNPGKKRSARRKSYCARSLGQMKKFPKAAADPNSRLRQARRRWKC